MRMAFSFLLIAWVGLACPVLCGIRAEASETTPTKASCCKHGHIGQDEPVGPAVPQEDGPDRCFCSAHGVLVQKSDPLQTEYFVQPLECQAALIQQSGVIQPLSGIPLFAPEAYRVLPLLI